MNSTLVDSLECPECRSPLEVSEQRSVFQLGARTHVVDGRLSCRNQHRFPIIDEVARLVPQARMLPEERAFLELPRAERTRSVVPETVSSQQVEADIWDQIARSYDLAGSDDPLARERAESEHRYLVAEYHGRNKLRYARLLQQLLPAADSVLDVGGSLPGLARVLSRAYGSGRTVVADLEPKHLAAFKTREREISLIRADVQQLPFAARSFDLVVSAFVLEHVPDWERATSCLLRTGRQVFLSFGPNRWFPYEIGHLDAPLAGTLPKPLAAYAAYLWLRMVGKKRPLSRIREILSGMSYISSRRFRSTCRKLGAEVTNVFPEFVSVTALDRDAPDTFARRFLRARPASAGVLARLLCRAGLEPHVYTFLRPRHAPGT